MKFRISLERKELCLLGQNVETVVRRGQNQAVFKGCCFTVVKKKQLMVKCCSVERYNLLFVQREFTIKLQQKTEIRKLCFYSVFQSYLNSLS